MLSALKVVKKKKKLRTKLGLSNPALLAIYTILEMLGIGREVQGQDLGDEGAGLLHLA